MRSPGGRGAARALAALALVLALPGPASPNGFPHFAISLEQLIALLQSPDPQHRLGAATSLGIRRERLAVEPLLEVVERPDEVEGVRAEAAESLGAIRDPRAVPRLVAHLGREGSVKVRAQIADVLGDLGGADALAALSGLVVSDGSPDVRGRAALALGRLRPDGARALLEERLAAEADIEVRAALVEALGLVGAPEAVPAVLDVFARASEPRLRGAAALALGRLGDRRAAAPLARALGDPAQEPSLRQAVALALARLRDAAAVPALEALLAEPDVVMVVLGVRALAEAGRPDAVAPLVKLGAATAREAVALRGLRSPEAFRRLVELLTLRIEIVQAVGRLGEPGAWPLIEQALTVRSAPAASAEALRIREREFELHRAGVLALAGLRDRRKAAVWLARELRDRDPRIRAEAARAVGLRREAAGFALLRGALRDPDPEVRWEAARAAGLLGAREGVVLLIHALGDRHPRVVAEAARALGALGADAARARLLALQERSEDEVREAAAEALLSLRR